MSNRTDHAAHVELTREYAAARARYLDGAFVVARDGDWNGRTACAKTIVTLRRDRDAAAALRTACFTALGG